MRLTSDAGSDRRLRVQWYPANGRRRCRIVRRLRRDRNNEWHDSLLIALASRPASRKYANLVRLPFSFRDRLTHFAIKHICNLYRSFCLSIAFRQYPARIKRQTGETERWGEKPSSDLLYSVPPIISNRILTDWLQCRTPQTVWILKQNIIVVWRAPVRQSRYSNFMPIISCALVRVIPLSVFFRCLLQYMRTRSALHRKCNAPLAGAI